MSENNDDKDNYGSKTTISEARNVRHVGPRKQKIKSRMWTLSATTKMSVILESMGLSPGLEAIKAIKQIKNPNQRAEKWIELHKFIEAPQAKVSIDLSQDNQPITIEYLVQNGTKIPLAAPLEVKALGIVEVENSEILSPYDEQERLSKVSEGKQAEKESEHPIPPKSHSRIGGRRKSPPQPKFEYDTTPPKEPSYRVIEKEYWAKPKAELEKEKSQNDAVSEISNSEQQGEIVVNSVEGQDKDND